MKLFSATTKKSYEVELFLKGHDYIIRHNSLKEIYNDMKADPSVVVHREFDQEEIGRLDQSTFYAYNCFLQIELDGKKYEADGFGSISYAEIMYSARRGEDISIKDSFRIEMARNRAFDDAFISLMRFSFEDEGHIVRSFYSSEAVSVNGEAKKLSGRNISRDAVQTVSPVPPAATAPMQPQAPVPGTTPAVNKQPQAPAPGTTPAVNKQAPAPAPVTAAASVENKQTPAPTPVTAAAPVENKQTQKVPDVGTVAPPVQDPRAISQVPEHVQGQASPIAMMGGDRDVSEQDWLNMFPGQDDPGTENLYPDEYQVPVMPEIPEPEIPEPEIPMPAAPAAPVYVAGIRDAEKGSAKVHLSNGKMLEYDPHLNEWFGDPGEGISIDQIETECEQMTGMSLSEYIRQASIYK